MKVLASYYLLCTYCMFDMSDAVKFILFRLSVGVFLTSVGSIYFEKTKVGKFTI